MWRVACVGLLLLSGCRAPDSNAARIAELEMRVQALEERNAALVNKLESATKRAEACKVEREQRQLDKKVDKQKLNPAASCSPGDPLCDRL